MFIDLENFNMFGAGFTSDFQFGIDLFQGSLDWSDLGIVFAPIGTFILLLHPILNTSSTEDISTVTTVPRVSGHHCADRTIEIVCSQIRKTFLIVPEVHQILLKWNVFLKIIIMQFEQGICI